MDFKDVTKIGNTICTLYDFTSITDALLTHFNIDIVSDTNARVIYTTCIGMLEKYPDIGDMKTLIVAGPITKTNKNGNVVARWILCFIDFEYTHLNMRCPNKKTKSLKTSITMDTHTGNIQVANPNIETRTHNPNTLSGILNIYASDLNKNSQEILYMLNNQQHPFHPKSPADITKKSRDLDDYLNSSIVQVKIDGVRLITVVQMVNDTLYVQSYSRHKESIATPPMIADFIDIAVAGINIPAVFEFECYRTNYPPSRVWSAIEKEYYHGIEYVLFNLIYLQDPQPYICRYEMIKKILLPGPYKSISAPQELKDATYNALMKQCENLSEIDPLIEGIVFWQKNERHDVFGGLNKCKLRYRELIKITDWANTANELGIILTGQSTSNITVHAKLSASDEQMALILDYIEQHNSLPTVLQGEVSMIHYGITANNKYKHPTIMMPTVETKIN